MSHFLHPKTPPTIAVINLPIHHTAVTVAATSPTSAKVTTYMPAFRELDPEQRGAGRTDNLMDYSEWFRDHHCEGCDYWVPDHDYEDEDGDGFEIIGTRRPLCRAYAEGGPEYVLSNGEDCYAGNRYDDDYDEDYEDYLERNATEDSSSSAPAPTRSNRTGAIHPPISLSGTIEFSSTRAYHDNLAIFYHFLIKRNGQWMRSEQRRAQNTYRGGSICWGKNNDYPETYAQAADSYRKSAFNYDLTTPSDERQSLILYRCFLKTPYNDDSPMPPMVSTPEDKADALAFPHPSSTAYMQLSMSGFKPLEGCIPLRRAVVQDIAGYLTPPHPAHGKAWFIAPNPTDPEQFILVGQV